MVISMSKNGPARVIRSRENRAVFTLAPFLHGRSIYRDEVICDHVDAEGVEGRR